jgi:hypothetical protein
VTGYGHVFVVPYVKQNMDMDRLTDFDGERDRLSRIATRILGSETEAEDVLQEARLRLVSAVDVDDLPAWFDDRSHPTLFGSLTETTNPVEVRGSNTS